MKKTDTSWGKSASWYNEMLENSEDSYQKAVILPGLLRNMEIKKGEKVLDLACGQGFFAREFYREGARVIGVDIAEELIKIAQEKSPNQIDYRVSAAHKLDFLKKNTIDKIAIILAIQNIENVRDVFCECNRILNPDGKMYLVLGHPAFRVYRQSSWGWDEEKNIQYRRIDRYLSEAKIKIQMHPGTSPLDFTISFHRPLQFYFKMFAKTNFAIRRMEEWISHKKSEPGPKSEAENRARVEIPMFLFLEAVKLRNI